MLGAVAGVVIIMVGLGSYSEVASDDDFSQYSWDEYNGYVHYRDTGDLGNEISINIECRLQIELDILVEVYLDDDEVGSHRGMTPVYRDFDLGITSTGEVEIYIDIQDTNYTIEDLSISVETNNPSGPLCGGILAAASLMIFLPLGIVFLILAFRKREEKVKDQTFGDEIEELEKKIRKMEKMGLDTTEEEKLLENYRKGLR